MAIFFFEFSINSLIKPNLAPVYTDSQPSPPLSFFSPFTIFPTRFAALHEFLEHRPPPSSPATCKQTPFLPPSIYFAGVFLKQGPLSSSTLQSHDSPFSRKEPPHFLRFSFDPPFPAIFFPFRSPRKSFKVLRSSLFSFSHPSTTSPPFIKPPPISIFGFPLFICSPLLLPHSLSLPSPPFYSPAPVFLLFFPRSSPVQRRFTRLRNSRRLGNVENPAGISGRFVSTPAGGGWYFLLGD